MFDEISSYKSHFKNKIEFVNSFFDKKSILRNIEEIDGELNNSNIWDNYSKAKALSKNRSSLISKLESIDKINKTYNDFIDAIDLAKEDKSYIEFAELSKSSLEEQISEIESEILLGDKNDSCDAIISINAGSGGQESEDWTSMLARMYTMWANKNNFSISIESFHDTSAGYDSITYKISGKNAFGKLKNENGVHRLIRNSPFDADFARHTSFAAVEVLPDIQDDISITIKESDCEITAIRGSGSGGQNVNKVSSCIRLKHIPTNIQIVSRSERDQLANKKAAFERLKAKLYQIEMDKKNNELNKYNESKADASFGHQIRSYVLSPFQMVNDHRTELKIQDANSVLDGNINPFIMESLKQNAKKK